MRTAPLVRPAHPTDVDGIQRVADAAWHAAYDDILGSTAVDEMLEEWYGDDAVEAGIDHEAQDFFVAVRGGTVVGYAHVGPHPPRHVHRLYRLYVHPDNWRSGIGRQLLAEVEQALYDRDVRVYEAAVLADNDLATAFYEASGFERVDEGETNLAGVSASEYRYRKQI
jgi:N-acetylglutamate synthase-like GNAT family acetyltransferase